jgi:hypothetical protein
MLFVVYDPREALRSKGFRPSKIRKEEKNKKTQVQKKNFAPFGRYAIAPRPCVFLLFFEKYKSRGRKTG